MNLNLNRRKFLTGALAGTVGLTLLDSSDAGAVTQSNGKRVGIIGLDTSHSIAFTKFMNAADVGQKYKGYKITAAYPYGSRDIESSASRIPGYIDQVKAMNVKIVDSIPDLLRQVDVVLLETNDGRLHLEQVLPVLKAGKRVFIDKPIAASLKDTLAIFEASKKYNVPLFSASSLRYIKGLDGLDKSKVVGAEAYSPASLEKTHPDLFWYGIHGVETLYTVMGTGCQEVTRVHTEGTDVVVGVWEGGRIGTFRGVRTGKPNYGGTVFTTEGNRTIGPYGGYEPLLDDIIVYFETGKVPVTPEETIEIFTFMEAADESKRQGGRPVKMADVLAKAKK